jgi:hypothetical protein
VTLFYFNQFIFSYVLQDNISFQGISKQGPETLNKKNLKATIRSDDSG